MADSGKSERVLSPREWAEIEEFWSLGDMTLDQLGDLYGVNPKYLSRALAARGIKKGSKSEAIKSKVREKVAEAALKKTSDTANKIQETKEDHYKYAKTLSALAIKLIAQKVSTGQSIASVREELRVIKDAIAVVELGRASRFAILGLDKDIKEGEEKTTLLVQEMTAEDIEEVRNKQSNDMFSDEVEEIERTLGDEESDQ